MDQKTINRLRQLNREFYQAVAEPFDASRQEAWLGWGRILDEVRRHFSLEKPLRMLDLGCGNGRWGNYFFEATKHPRTTYIGVDENQKLLQAAGRALLLQAQLLELRHQDLETYVAQASHTQTADFDLIVLFGVWHHLPGYEQRLHLLEQLAILLKPSGLLVISCWRFRRSPTLRARLVDPINIGIHPTQLESGDYFLDWRSGISAVRYCHDTVKSELLNQAQHAQLELLQTFSADGKTGDLNDYYVFTPKHALAV